MQSQGIHGVSQYPLNRFAPTPTVADYLQRHFDDLCNFLIRLAFHMSTFISMPRDKSIVTLYNVHVR
jgi:hypothetical protein